MASRAKCWGGKALKTKDRREKRGSGPETRNHGCLRGPRPLRRGRVLVTSLQAGRSPGSGSLAGPHSPESVAIFDSWFRTSLMNQRTREHGAPDSRWDKQAGWVSVCVSPVPEGGPDVPCSRGASPTPHGKGAQEGPKNVCWTNEQQKPGRSVSFCIYSVRCANRFSGGGAHPEFLGAGRGSGQGHCRGSL